MKNKHTDPLSGKDLDNLLNESFLNLDFKDPQNTQLMESIAHYTMAATPATPSAKSKTLFTKLLLSLLTLGIIGIAAFLLTKKNPVPAVNTAPVSLVKPVVSDTVEPSETGSRSTLATQKATGSNPALEKTNPLEYPMPYAAEKETPEQPEEVEAVAKPISIADKRIGNNDYVFPVLTEKEMKTNEKEKRRMGKMAARLGRERYALIPRKTWYMQTTEVSNLEYRTFLFDLLIQGKKDDFLKAKPDQSLWKNSNGTNKFDNFEKPYFTDKRFKDYPVVNITAEGAAMYCRWLTDLADATLKKDGNTSARFEFLIPMESEWLYAAQNGKPDAIFPWPLDSIQNHFNCLLGNFCIQKLKDQIKQPFGYKNTININAFTSAGMATNTDTMATADVTSYNPNDYNLYCMSGNVSELVYTDGTNVIKTKGGNWASDFQHLKLNSEDEFKAPIKASPMIGFRVEAKPKH